MIGWSELGPGREGMEWLLAEEVCSFLGVGGSGGGLGLRYFGGGRTKSTVRETLTPSTTSARISLTGLNPAGISFPFASVNSPLCTVAEGLSARYSAIT